MLLMSRVSLPQVHNTENLHYYIMKIVLDSFQEMINYPEKFKEYGTLLQFCRIKPEELVEEAKSCKEVLYEAMDHFDMNQSLNTIKKKDNTKHRIILNLMLSSLSNFYKIIRKHGIMDDWEDPIYDLWDLYQEEAPPKSFRIINSLTLSKVKYFLE